MSLPDDPQAALLTYLRRRFESSGLSYTEPPAPITGGYNTKIWGFRVSPAPKEFDRPLVLRLYPTPRYEMHAQSEFARQRFVFDRGYPVPEPLLVEADSNLFGGPFLIMERVPYRAMLDRLLAPGPYALRGPRLMAEVHARLHSVAADGFPGYVPGAYLELRLKQFRELIESRGRRAMEVVLGWLEDNRPAEPADEVICHNDFHPINILVDERGEVGAVVDWENSVVADRHRDVAHTLVLLRGAPVQASFYERLLAAGGRRLIARIYLRSYRRIKALNDTTLRYYETLAALSWLQDLMEWRDAAAGRIEGRGDRAYLATEEVVERFHRYIERRSGVRIPR